MNDYQRDLYNGPLLVSNSSPDPSRLAWLAGFIDGEGTITLNSRTTKRGSSISPRLSITNTNLQNMGRARVILAAIVCHDVLIGEQRSAKGYRPAFTLTLHSHMDLDLTLHALYPYLVGKWQQAFIVLDFLVARIKRLNLRYSPSMWAAREADQTAQARVDVPSGVVPMDPLKRWYKLHCG